MRRTSRHREGELRLRRVDPALGALIDNVGPFRPVFGGPALHDVLLASIVHQQISLGAATAILGRLRMLAGGAAAPQPADLAVLADDALRAAGLSRRKIAAVRDLAVRLEDGRLDPAALRGLDDTAATAALCAVRGVGPWTAQMALIFHLDRPDIWPAADIGLQEAVRRHLGLDARPDARRTEELGRRWAPDRSLAAWYLWTLVDEAGPAVDLALPQGSTGR